jgi:putative oxidoreductase
MTGSKFESLRPYTLSLMRIFGGLVYWLHGIQKLFGVLALPGQHVPVPAGSQLWYAAVLETVLGALIILGLFTVPAAFVASGEMAVAYFISHIHRGSIFPVKNGGDAAVLLAFLFLYLFAAGPGPLSLDYLIRKARHKGEAFATSGPLPAR